MDGGAGGRPREMPSREGREAGGPRRAGSAQHRVRGVSPQTAGIRVAHKLPGAPLLVGPWGAPVPKRVVAERGGEDKN